MSKRIGSLWRRQKGNMKYMSGTIEVIAGQRMNIAVFKNDRKQNPKSPDYQIVLSEPQRPKNAGIPVKQSDVKKERVEDTEDW